MKTWFWIWFFATQKWKEMDRTIKILNDYPYECLFWKNKISEVKRLTPFLRFCPRISRITRIESCKAAFL
jgi:hypothetical protein